MSNTHATLDNNFDYGDWWLIPTKKICTVKDDNVRRGLNKMEMELKT